MSVYEALILSMERKLISFCFLQWWWNTSFRPRCFWQYVSRWTYVCSDKSVAPLAKTCQHKSEKIRHVLSSCCFSLTCSYYGQRYTVCMCACAVMWVLTCNSTDESTVFDCSFGNTNSWFNVGSAKQQNLGYQNCD